MNNIWIGIVRYFVGYAIGISIFVILIPAGLWYLSTIDWFLFQISILPFGIPRLVLSFVLFVIGAAFVLWSNLFLVWKGKGGPTDFAGVSISPQTKYLVVDGPYRYSRNPMVFGANTMYLAITLYLNSLGSLLALAVFFYVLVRYVVSTEEQRLFEDFGDEYAAYQKRTPKFVPLMNRRREPE